MAVPSNKFEGVTPNLVLKGDEEQGIDNLLVHRSCGAFVSCWELSEEERDQIARTGKIYLSILGPQHPPVALNTNPDYLVGDDDQLPKIES